MTPVYIIDYSNFAYKFKSVHQYAKFEAGGVPVDISVIVGFIRSLKQNMFSDILIALDGMPEQSLSIIPGYKGQRTKESLDVVSFSKLETIQFLTQIGPLINKNISVICSPFQEADQVIASVATKVVKALPPKAALMDRLNKRRIVDDPYLTFLEKEYLITYTLDTSDYDTVVIGTTDSDMKALTVYDNVLIDTSTSGKALRSDDTAKAVSEVNPAAIPIYKAIYGDTSDNVPGYKISKDLIPILNRTVKTIDDANKFIQVITTATVGSCPKEWVPFATALQSDGASQFRKNLMVVSLGFVSTPKVLHYPYYRINTTIEKLKLRI